MKTLEDKITNFFSSPAFGVVGASSNRHKFGNKVLRTYLQHGKLVYPVNPNEIEIEGLVCFKDVTQLPREVASLSIITPPIVTEQIVKELIHSPIKQVWMQPGAESDEAIALCEKNNIEVIAGGPCLLVILGFKDE